MDKQGLDYLQVLKALQEIPFAVGRKLLISFLQGKEEASIERNHLSDKNHFGSLAYSTDEINGFIDNLIMNNLIAVTALKDKKFWKVLELTPKGRMEIEKPALYRRKMAFNLKQHETIIDEKDKEIFEQHSDFLSRFNAAQKKGITSSNKKILCVAGAGSGKTTVLTKRIEFFVKYRAVDPSKILAITFTRKARAEMSSRLSGIDSLKPVHIETFNSFCEKILLKNASSIYAQEVRVLSYSDKIKIIDKALAALNTTFAKTLDAYFSTAQKKSKAPEQLATVFMNDCFFIRDYFKFKNISPAQSELAKTNEPGARIIFGACSYIEAYMKKNGLRDFADQLLDAIVFFEGNAAAIPCFDHILIDEYQDVNSTQMKLIDILHPGNIFCVGDPRQSIFGWRGSDVRYILNFEEKYPACEIITLTKNYRSAKPIVALINSSIRRMGLANLESAVDLDSNVKLLQFSAEEEEFEFVIQSILASDIPRQEIFVLARTNRQLQDISRVFTSRRIPHIVRSDELRSSVLGKEDEVTLATIHAIKGLEAETVFVIGCNGAYFPCKGSEHPVIEMVKVDEYDKEEEERRLFYVAMSRAKKNLYLTFTAQNPTYFVTDEMLEILDQKELKLPVLRTNSLTTNSPRHSGNLFTALKTWRWTISKELQVPPYMIVNNRTLEDITQKMPATPTELEKVYGMGPVKIMKFGKDILRLVNQA